MEFALKIQCVLPAFSIRFQREFDKYKNVDGRVCILSIKYRYRDILLKNVNFIYNHLFCCNHTCNCVNMVSLASPSRYHPRHQSRSSMYIRGQFPRNFAELAEAVPIDQI